MKRFAVFCGSSSGSNGIYKEHAVKLGKLLAGKSIELVFGGGKVGLMGVLADAVLEAGGSAVGVIPGFLNIKEVAHTGVSELITVSSMHERKAMMADLADAFIALPGGWGTLEEIFEMLTWAQLGFHEKPCGLLNISGYFDNLVAFLETSFEKKFVKELYRPLLMTSPRPASLLDQFTGYQAPKVRKWMGEDEL
jgi:uncharacterized protein (TIGR00730 family)